MRNIYALEVIACALLLIFILVSLVSLQDFFNENQQKIIYTQQILQKHEYELVSNFDNASFKKLNIKTLIPYLENND